MKRFKHFNLCVQSLIIPNQIHAARSWLRVIVLWCLTEVIWKWWLTTWTFNELWLSNFQNRTRNVYHLISGFKLSVDLQQSRANKYLGYITSSTVLRFPLTVRERINVAQNQCYIWTFLAVNLLEIKLALKNSGCDIYFFQPKVW